MMPVIALLLIIDQRISVVTDFRAQAIGYEGMPGSSDLDTGQISSCPNQRPASQGADCVGSGCYFSVKSVTSDGLAGILVSGMPL